jgi:hypothetical protein
VVAEEQEHQRRADAHLVHGRVNCWHLSWLNFLHSSWLNCRNTTWLLGLKGGGLLVGITIGNAFGFGAGSTVGIRVVSWVGTCNVAENKITKEGHLLTCFTGRFECWNLSSLNCWHSSRLNCQNTSLLLGRNADRFAARNIIRPSTWISGRFNCRHPSSLAIGHSKWLN